CLGGGQTGDGFEETLAVPERHTKLLEVDVCQLRQDIGVDLTRAKERLVLSEAETSEPTPDIHGRTPRARTDHPSVEAPCPGPGCSRTEVSHDDPTGLPIRGSALGASSPIRCVVSHRLQSFESGRRLRQAIAGDETSRSAPSQDRLPDRFCLSYRL